MAKQTTSEPLHLVIDETREYGYFHVNVSIATERYENGHWWPYGTQDRYDDPLQLSHLRITCQGDERSRTGSDRQEPVYGFDVCYRDVHSVDAQRVKRMARTLAKIETGLQKLSESRGYARSFGDYCGRVAEILKCKGAFDRNSRETESVSGQTYRRMSVGDAVNAIDHRIYTWQREAINSAVSA